MKTTITSVKQKLDASISQLCEMAYKANFSAAVYIADNSFLVMCLHPMLKLSFEGMFLQFAPAEAGLAK